MTHALPLAAPTPIDTRHWLAAFTIAAVLHALVFLQWPSDEQAGAEAPGVGGISVSIAMTASLAGADQSSAEPVLTDQPPIETAAEIAAAAIPVEPAAAPPIQDTLEEPVLEPVLEPVVPESLPVEDVATAEPVELVPEAAAITEPPPEDIPIAEPVAAPETDVATEVVTAVVNEVVPPPRPPVRPQAIEPEIIQPAVQPPVVEARAVPAPPAQEPAVREPTEREPAGRETTVQAPSPLPDAAPAAVQPQRRAGTPAADSSAAATASTGQAADVPVGTATDIRSASGGAAVSAPSPNYIATLRLWLERHKDYPKMARRKRMQGIVQLYFRVARDGTVLAQEIREASGHALLDEAARDMLARATPLPAFPKDMEGDYLDVVLPVEYALRGNR